MTLAEFGHTRAQSAVNSAELESNEDLAAAWLLTLIDMTRGVVDSLRPADEQDVRRLAVGTLVLVCSQQRVRSGQILHVLASVFRSRTYSLASPANVLRAPARAEVSNHPGVRDGEWAGGCWGLEAGGAR